MVNMILKVFVQCVFRSISLNQKKFLLIHSRAYVKICTEEYNEAKKFFGEDPVSQNGKFPYSRSVESPIVQILVFSKG